MEDDQSSADALAGFLRFPMMWRNADVLDFVGWPRTHNMASGAEASVGFYGLDLYSLFTSITAVLAYLDKVDPAAAQRARSRYGCFDHFGEDSQAYGYTASFDLSRSCEDEVITQLLDLRRHAAKYAQRDGRVATLGKAGAAKNLHERPEQDRDRGDRTGHPPTQAPTA